MIRPRLHDISEPAETPAPSESAVNCELESMTLVMLDEFSTWIDGELEQLESRFRGFWTRHSVMGNILRSPRGN
jgi:hypothetical protein